MSSIQATPGCSAIGMNINLGAGDRMVSVEREQVAAAQPAQPEAAVTKAGGQIATTDRASEHNSQHNSELRNTRLSFGYDEESGRVYVQVVRSDTGEVVRQRPPESMLEMLAKIREMIGLILDEKA